MKDWQLVDDHDELTAEADRLMWLRHLAVSIMAIWGCSPPSDRERNVELVKLAEADNADEHIGEDFPTWMDDHYRDKLIDMVGQVCIGEIR